MKKYRLI